MAGSFRQLDSLTFFIVSTERQKSTAAAPRYLLANDTTRRQKNDRHMKSSSQPIHSNVFELYCSQCSVHCTVSVLIGGPFGRGAGGPLNIFTNRLWLCSRPGPYSFSYSNQLIVRGKHKPNALSRFVNAPIKCGSNVVVIFMHFTIGFDKNVNSKLHYFWIFFYMLSSTVLKSSIFIK